MRCFEDVSIGEEIAPLTKEAVSRQMLAEWCAAENDYYAVHYDERLAKSMGMPGSPIQGTLKLATIGRMLEIWHGESGSLESISASYRGFDVEGATITARGLVTGKVQRGNEGGIEIDVWIENAEGQRSLNGKAVVVLPHRTLGK